MKDKRNLYKFYFINQNELLFGLFFANEKELSEKINNKHTCKIYYNDKYINIPELKLNENIVQIKNTYADIKLLEIHFGETFTGVNPMYDNYKCNMCNEYFTIKNDSHNKYICTHCLNNININHNAKYNVKYKHINKIYTIDNKNILLIKSNNEVFLKNDNYYVPMANIIYIKSSERN